MKPRRRLPTPVHILATVVTAGIGLTGAASGSGEVATRGSAARAYGSAQLDQAAGARALKTIVTGNVEPATAFGPVDGAGLYTAQVAQAASAADPPKSGSADAVVSPPSSIDPSAFLQADRATVWNPGMMGVGGIPIRSTVCSTLTPRGGGQDDTAQIQVAIRTCPAGQVVQLGAGTFIINSGNFVLLNKGITLRGAGPGQTTLAKTNGAKPDTEAVGANPSPLIIVGPSRWSPTNDPGGIAGSTNLTADAVKGANTVTVGSTAGFSPGQIVLLDEASGAGWQTDPQGRGQIWASPDWRVVWQKHNPVVPYMDDLAADAFPTTPGSAGAWFSRLDRPTEAFTSYKVYSRK
jgi:hypothetical protein